MDNKTELLKGVSLLELCLLIAIKHLVGREITTFNFEMVYDEYKEFMDMAIARGSSSSSIGVSSGGAMLSSESTTLRLYKKAVALKVCSPFEDHICHVPIISTNGFQEFAY